MPEESEAEEEEYQPQKRMNMAERPPRIMNDRQPTPQQQNPQDRYKVCREWAHLVVGFLTLVAVIYYAVQAQIQAAANKEAADAAAASAKAWIGLNGAVSSDVKDTQALFVLAFTNVGKTPALDTETTWEFLFSQGPDESSAPKMTACPTTHKNTPGLIQAGQPWTVAMDEQLSEVKVKMLHEKTAHLYIHGCATYHDVLTPTERVTEFCIVYPAFFGEGFSLYAPNNRMR